MTLIPTPLAGLLLIEPRVFSDARGFFFESFNQQAFDAAFAKQALARQLPIAPPRFVQDNHSQSYQGVLRGLHYQIPPYAQGKLVRVVQGEVWDVSVDIRRHSSTFGKWYGTLLSEANQRQLWIPEGFAHGFLTLSETSTFLYKTTHYYSPQHERSIAWNDPDLAIDWQLHRLKDRQPLLSPKDENADSLRKV